MKRAFFVALVALSIAAPAAAQRRAGPPEPANPFDGNAQAAAQGEQVYNQNCTSCHGMNGGAGEIGPAIVPSTASNLRGTRTEFQLLEKVRNGVPGTAMQAWKGKLSDDDILKIGAYFHELRGTAIDSPLPGDVAHGEQIFFGKGQCSTCHAIDGKGGLIGPDLTNIAGSRKSTNIIAALTQQQHHIYMDGGDHIPDLPPMDSYDAVHVELKSGKPIDGVLLNQDGFSLQIMGMDNQLHLLNRDQVKSIVKKPPLMPTDYDKRLSPAEFKDLLAFLTRQGREAPVAARPGGTPN